jgi:hypothetical protein
MGAPDHLLGPLACSADPPALNPLYATPQWIVVLLVPQPNGKTKKIPVSQTAQVGIVAHDRQYHTDYATAKSLAELWGGIDRGSGAGFTVGFVLTESDPYFCLDIDNALQPDNTWSELAQQLCSLPNCAIEVSQSGRGLHVWGHTANLPAHASKNVALGIELYSRRRMIAIGRPGAIGDITQPCPDAALKWLVDTYFPPRDAALPVHGDGPRPGWNGPADDDELIRRALASRSAAGAFGARATFADLFDANVEVLARSYPPDRSSSEPYDRSSADAACAQHLAFWTGCDAARMERLMRRSKLEREKWDAHSSYLSRTIAKACGQQREVLQDKPIAAPDVPTVSTAGAGAFEVLGAGEVPNGPDGESQRAFDAVPGGPPAMTTVEGDTFLSAAAQRQVLAGCVYVVDHHKALVPGGTLLNPDRFKARFGGYTWVMDNRNERVTRNAWEAFTESQVLRAPRADGTCFKPGLPFGTVIESEGRKCVNTYWPISVRRLQGSVEPFERHLRLLLPHDWRVLLYFMAGIVQFPGVKFQWMPLIVGVEGNGKTFFSRCVAHAVGKRYTHWPAADKLDSRFNEWLFGKLFYAIEDLKIGNNTAAWEKLKPLITGENVEIEGKGVDQRSDEICGNFIANSNHFDAIRATRNDRRVAHLHCAQQSIDDLNRDGINEQYLSDLYRWANGDGFAIVAEYLHTLPIPPEFGEVWLTGRAPATTGTATAIEYGRSAVEQAVLDAIEEDVTGFKGGWISTSALSRLLSQQRLEAPKADRDNLLGRLGYVRHPGLGATGQVHHRVQPDGNKPRLYIRKDHAHAKLTAPAEIARAYSAAQASDA